MKPTSPIEVGTHNMPTNGDLLTDPGYFAHLQEVAQTLSKSNLIPKHYRGPSRVPDIVVALDMAQRLRVPPIPFLQATYVAQDGAPMAIEGKLAIALINAYGPFEGLLDWDYERDIDGKITACTCYGTLKDGSRRKVTLNQDDLDRTGWGGIYEREKNNRGKWVSNGKRLKDDPNSWWTKTPEQMYAYRTAMFLARRYCPEVVMGMITVDEQIDGLQPGKLVETESSIWTQDDFEERAAILEYEGELPRAEAEALARKHWAIPEDKIKQLEPIPQLEPVPAEQIKQLEASTETAFAIAERLKQEEQDSGWAIPIEDELITKLAKKLNIKANEEGNLLDFLDLSAEKFGKTRLEVTNAALTRLDLFRERLNEHSKK